MSSIQYACHCCVVDAVMRSTTTVLAHSDLRRGNCEVFYMARGGKKVSSKELFRSHIGD
jgi:hypothetical protein